ncbi:putative secreted protein (Por secretion system target) [Breznakibacter xylanolyticus]|uniref:Putative secreted protein (Por secretion system target) n=1 Tax=Breznakibacter xylanolyticus TaxID=990 RepID=A0A2W7NKW2_9BACT|nr:T9SS type A sorting domain-containing protein [Breznakibacter xylanolyticus]PZX13836.1 putative secreted protein (Por secretion system target) [Breznakibacter xylanolyticus]
MRNLYILWLLCFVAYAGVSAQTVIKMDMPRQADKALKVVSLFDDEIPQGVPVVLGLMGYDIEGGAAPYQFEWLLNNQVISTTDVAVFTANKGDQLVLKVIDNTQCQASTAFNLKFAHLESVKSYALCIYPTLVIDHIQVDLPDEWWGEETWVRIFDLKGKVVASQFILQSQSIPVNLVPGSYFVSAKSKWEHRVEKIIVR